MTDSEILGELRRVLCAEAEAVKKLSTDMDGEQVLKVAKALRNCTGKVITSGCGTSAVTAKKIAHSMSCIEIPAIFLSPSDAVHGALGVLQENDVFILISKGGNTQELTQMIPACRTKKALLIGVSENPDSVIAQNADIFLRIKVDREPDKFNMLATASTIATIAMFDAICIALMQMSGYTREQFAVIHPGGDVGDRLLHGKA